MIKWIKKKIAAYKTYRHLLKLAKEKPLACWSELMRNYFKGGDK
jgi:hypothetical protein